VTDLPPHQAEKWELVSCPLYVHHVSSRSSCVSAVLHASRNQCRIIAFQAMATPELEGYVYQDLPRHGSQIRLLRLEHSSDQEFTSGTPKYNIQTFEIDSAPSYWALSYVWGSDPPSKEIILDDNKTFSVTATRYDFLRRFRKSKVVLLDDNETFLVTATLYDSLRFFRKSKDGPSETYLWIVSLSHRRSANRL
jgi:dipeptidyl aminopeptidase/acylaminoacyl peptidase